MARLEIQGLVLINRELLVPNDVVCVPLHELSSVFVAFVYECSRFSPAKLWLCAPATTH